MIRAEAILVRVRIRVGEVSDGHYGGGGEVVEVGMDGWMDDFIGLRVSSSLIKEIGRTFSDLRQSCRPA